MLLFLLRINIRDVFIYTPISYIFKARVQDAECNAIRSEKICIDRLEAKIECLTADIDNELRCKNEYAKNWRKCERKLKETEFQLGEERKNVERSKVRYFHL